MRTPEDIAHTDAVAAEINYEAPPAHLEPTGLMYEDSTWQDLVDWFRGRGFDRWSTPLQVYISRRWDEPMSEVYLKIDGWVAAQLERIDREENPQDFTGGFSGGYN